MKIDEIASNAKYWKDEQFEDLTICWESSQFSKFVNFYFLITYGVCKKRK